MTASSPKSSVGSRFIANILAWLASNLTGRLVSALLFILLTNYVSLAEAGAYTLGLTFLALLMPLSLWGLDQLFIRDAAQNRQHVHIYLVRFILPRVLLAAATYMVLVGLVFAIGYTATTRTVILVMGLAILTENVNGLLQAYFVVIEKTTHIMYIVLPVNLMRLFVGYLVLLNGSGAVGLAAIFTATSVLTMLLLLGMITCREKRLKLTEGVALDFWYQQFKLAYPFVLIDVTWAIEYQIGQVLVSIYLGEEATGLYATAFMVVSMLTLISQAYMLTIFPVMSKLYHTSSTRLGFVYDQSCRYLLLVALLVAVVLSVMSREILAAVFPASFETAGPVLAILAWSLVFTFLNVPNSRLMIIQNRQDRQALYMGVSAVANVLLNLWLIPQVGIAGAALARVLSSAIFFVPNYLFVYTHIHRFNLLRIALRPVLIALGVTGVLLLLKPWHLALSMTGGMAFFIAAVLLLRVVTPADLHLFRQALEGETVAPA